MKWTSAADFRLLALLERQHVADVARRIGRSESAIRTRLWEMDVPVSRFTVTTAELARATGYGQKTLRVVAERLGLGRRGGDKPRSRLRLLRHEAAQVVAWLSVNALTPWDDPASGAARAASRRQAWTTHESRARFAPGHRHGARTLVRAELRTGEGGRRQPALAWLARCDAGHERWLAQHTIDKGEATRCQECGWSYGEVAA